MSARSQHVLQMDVDDVFAQVFDGLRRIVAVRGISTAVEDSADGSVSAIANPG